MVHVLERENMIKNYMSFSVLPALQSYILFNIGQLLLFCCTTDSAADSSCYYCGTVRLCDITLCLFAIIFRSCFSHFHFTPLSFQFRSLSLLHFQNTFSSSSFLPSIFFARILLHLFFLCYLNFYVSIDSV